MKLWNDEKDERLVYYPAENKKSRTAVLIFPGGGYEMLADHEGKGYAEFLNENGCDAFVCCYRVAPDRFPAPLLDARRAMRLIRKNAEEYGVAPDRIAVMGSSAGGNLAALLSTFTDPLAGEEKDDLCGVVPFLPNAQILCYPVITLADESIVERGSRGNLFGGDLEGARAVSPEFHVTEDTPPAFLWHTADDGCVPVGNSLLYTSVLRAHGVPVELHVFPHGWHGLGLAKGDPSVGVWPELLLRWLKAL